MATSQWRDLTTEDILSAHISGLSHSVKKFEETLNMKTAQATFMLLPVTDQEDLSLRYRIYEGQHRNWTDFSITRNGETVDSAEYVAQPAFGVIVFLSPQAQTDVIEVTATYISNQSSVIEGINSSISTIETDIEALKGTDSYVQPGYFNLSTETGKRYSNLRPGLNPDAKIAEPFDNVLMSMLRLDAMPMILTETTTITKMSITFNAASPTANNLLGIYSNKNVAEPDKLLAETGVIRHGVSEREVLVGNLLSPVTLEPGVYWLVRWHNDAVRLSGHLFDPLVHNAINPPSESVTDAGAGFEDWLACGVRSQVSTGYISKLPATFPAIGPDAKYLIRSGIGTIYAIT